MKISELIIFLVAEDKMLSYSKEIRCNLLI